MLVINFKNYKIGNEVTDLLRKIEIYFNKAIIAVPTTELKEIIKGVSSQNIQVIAQHVDYHEAGRGTGYTIPESLINAGVRMSLLNHSEHKLKMPEIRKTVKRCNELGMKLIVCASSVKEAKDLIKLNPYAIAFEDKKLISTGKSITDYNEEDLKKFAALFENSSIVPLCGAGISKGEDVAKALLLGCKGVLVSSVVASSQAPEKFLKEASEVM
jgi:triosephosphate isomerase (TIM)